MILRLLQRRSGPVLGAIAVIGIGVGLAAMVFALADPYVARALPYADPDRLVSIEFGLGDPRAMVQASQDHVPSLASWQARTDLFEGLAAFDDAGWLRARLSDRVVPLRAVAVTDNLLEVLGLERRSVVDATEAWVSNRAATTLSGGELSPGRSVPVMPGGTLRVVSILPKSFLLPLANRTEAVDALVILPSGPIMTIKQVPRSRSALSLVGRMGPDVTPEMIEAALGPSVRSTGSSLSVVPLWTRMTARQRALARGAFLASALVIVICWMNVFNIALTRGLYREPELATRTALGATPRQLVFLMVADGLRVATLGSVAALSVAWVALTGAVGVLPAEFATLGVPSVTMRVAAFIGLAGAVACLAWCLASIVAWRLGARRRERPLVSRDGRPIRVLRFGIIAGQVGAASVLLTGAALLGRSYVNLIRVDAGMDEQTQTMTVVHDPSLPPVVRSEVVERVAAALRRREGVQAVGVKSGSMLDGRWGSGAILPDGQVGVLELVDRGFFDAVGLQYRVGGPPEPDQTGAVITESIARKYFAGRSPIGSQLIVGRAMPVVGVIRDVRTFGLSVAPRPVVYEVGATWPSYPTASFTYLVRSADRRRPFGAWQQILRPIDPMAVILSDGTVGDRLARSVRDRTFATLVVGLFASASLLVTAVGLAGVVAYTVVKRTREVAIRLTLGATHPRVTWLVVRDALTAAVFGAIGGVIASVWLSSALESLLYGIRAADPTTLLFAAASLLGIVIAAAILPAMRTGRIAPATALRIE
jgi:predicted permease